MRRTASNCESHPFFAPSRPKRSTRSWRRVSTTIWRSAVVWPVSLMATRSRSTRTTDFPALARRYEEVRPAMPAPTTMTSARWSASTGPWEVVPAVSIQREGERSLPRGWGNGMPPWGAGGRRRVLAASSDGQRRGCLQHQRAAVAGRVQQGVRGAAAVPRGAGLEARDAVALLPELDVGPAEGAVDALIGHGVRVDLRGRRGGGRAIRRGGRCARKGEQRGGQ